MSMNGVLPFINSPINSVDSGGTVFDFAHLVNLFRHIFTFNKDMVPCNMFQFSSISWHDLAIFIGSCRAW